METLGIDKNAVSYDDFSQALLADGPIDQETSHMFWEAVSTRAGAEQVAQVLTENADMAAMAARYGVVDTNLGSDDANSMADALWNVGALRPLLDEYFPENERQAFLNKYGDILLEGLPLEHIAVASSEQDDQQDTVPASSLPASWAASLPSTARIRLQMVAYRSNVDDDLYALWKEHKAGRARYEEKLFRTKRLGLVYGEDARLHDKDAHDDDDDL